MYLVESITKKAKLYMDREVYLEDNYSVNGRIIVDSGRQLYQIEFIMELGRFKLGEDYQITEV